MSQGRGTGRGPARLSILYKAPGPICAAYIRSHARVKVIMGPVGSGKTRGMQFDGWNRACSQPPSPIDGLRRSGLAACGRPTGSSGNRRSRAGTSWCRRTWASGSAATTSRCATPSPSITRAATAPSSSTCATSSPSATGASRRPAAATSRPTGSSTSSIPCRTRSYCLSRAGRYPDKIHGFPWWYGVRAASNAFDLDSVFYDKLVENRPPEWRLFVQPDGLSPKAENRKNLVPTYYQDQMVGAAPDFVRKYVRNEYGFSRDGRPVYEEFHDTLHVSAEPLKPVAGLPLIIGADAGLTPAAAICQRAPDGRWLVLDELVFVGGGKAFGEQLNRLLAEPRYRDVVADAAFLRLVGGETGSAEAQHRRSLAQAVQGWCDPAAGARVATDERSWVEVVSAVTGIAFRPAPSNALSLRLEAVRQPMARLIDGRPGLLVSPTCKVLRRGFNSAYKFKRVFVGGAQIRAWATALDQSGGTCGAGTPTHPGGGAVTSGGQRPVGRQTRRGVRKRRRPKPLGRRRR